MKKKSAAISIVILLIFSLSQLPIFKIKTISIINQPHFTSKSTYSTFLDSYINSNIFRALLFKKIHAHFKALNSIDSIKINYIFPNKLTLSLIERKPWISCIINNQSIFIDKEGYILKRNSSNNAIADYDIFIVKGLKESHFQSKKIRKSLLHSLQTFNTTFKTYFPEKPLLLEYLSPQSWRLSLDDTVSILLPNSLSPAQTFKYIHYFLDSIDAKTYNQLNYIDARVAQKLFIKYETNR